jgi:hypothetical protein
MSIEINSFRLEFYTWVNLWHSTLDLISHYVVKNKLFIPETIINRAHSHHQSLVGDATSFLNMKRLLSFSSESDQTNNSDKDDSFNKYNSNDKLLRHMSHIDSSVSKKLEVELGNFLINKINKNNNINININNKITKKNKKEEILNNHKEIKLLVDNLGKDHDLNNFIKGLQRIAQVKKAPLFDKESIDLHLNSHDLDKFSNAKDVADDFSLNLNFKIIE